MAKRKKKQFNAPPVGGPLPRGARGSQDLSTLMAPLVDPPKKYLKKITKLYGEHSDDYNKAYVQWYSERINEIADRITYLWTTLDYEDRMGIASDVKGKNDSDHRRAHRRDAVGGNSPMGLNAPLLYGDAPDIRGKVSPDGERKFRKILNETDSLSIWLMKSQRQFTGHPLVATHDDIVGHLKRKVDPNIAYEGWDKVFFKHSPFIEMRFQDSPLPSMILGQQHEKASGYLLSVIVDTYNHRESYALKFNPDTLMSFLSGEPYERGLDIMQPSSNMVGGYDGTMDYLYPQASAGSHKRPPYNRDSMPLPFFNKEIMEKFAEEATKRGYDPEAVIIYMSEMSGSPSLEAYKKEYPVETRRAHRDGLKKILAEMMPESVLDEIITKIYNTHRLIEPSTECPVALDVQAEIRQTLWVSLSLLKDAAKEIIKFTNPKERKESDEGTPAENGEASGEARADYVAPQFRWKIIPKRTRLSAQTVSRDGNGRPKPPHGRHAHRVTYRASRYSDELRNTTVIRGEGGISIKGYDGPLPQEILGYDPSPEEKAKIEAQLRRQGKGSSMTTMVKPKEAPKQAPKASTGTQAPKTPKTFTKAPKTPTEAPKVTEETLEKPVEIPETPTTEVPPKAPETPTEDTDKTKQVTPSQHKQEEEKTKKKLHDRANKADIKTGYWRLLVKRIRNFFRR